ncbi:MAG: outer membrane lipoprotein chaperone LolA, partial [Steroidobacter sp.]
MLKKFLISQLLIILTCGVAHAHTPVSKDEGYAALDKFLNGLQSLQSDFTQTVQDSREQIVEKTAGTLAIKRPGKFRWDYAKPHEQTIVCDGARIWLYDPELEQLTIRSVDQTISGTPAMLLSSEGANNNLKTSFNIENVQRHEDMLIINLSPKRADADFKLVQLALKGSDLVAMSLTDKLGQTTLVEFNQFKRNAA